MADIDDKLHRRLLEELHEESPSQPSPTLAGLVTSRSPEWLFERAVSLLDSPSGDERILGSRFLRELPAQWAQPAGGELLQRLSHEDDPDVLAWFVHALAFLRSSEALLTVLTFKSHPEAAVREAVVAAISACSEDLSNDACCALATLASDPDPEVRFSAVFELGSWWQDGLRTAVVGAALRQAIEDSAPFVRNAATAALLS